MSGLLFWSVSLSIALIVSFIVYSAIAKPATTTKPNVGKVQINLHNLDPGLDGVKVSLSSGEEYLEYGMSIYGVNIGILDRITAIGTRGSINYDLSFQINTLVKGDIYFSTGGAFFGGESYIQYFTAVNNTGSDFILKATDGKKEVYTVTTVGSGSSVNFGAWVGQTFSGETGSSATIKSSTDSKILLTLSGIVLPKPPPGPKPAPTPNPTPNPNPNPTELQLGPQTLSSSAGDNMSFNFSSQGGNTVVVDSAFNLQLSPDKQQSLAVISFLNQTPGKIVSVDANNGIFIGNIPGITDILHDGTANGSISITSGVVNFQT